MRGRPTGLRCSTCGVCTTTVLDQRITRTQAVEAGNRKLYVLKHTFYHFSPIFEMHCEEEAFESLLTNFESCGVTFKDLGEFFLRRPEKCARPPPLGRFFLEAKSRESNTCTTQLLAPASSLVN